LPTSGVGSGVGGGGVGAGVARRRRGGASFFFLSATERSILTVSAPTAALERPANWSLLASTDGTTLAISKHVKIFVARMILQNYSTVFFRTK
jgi:hypothetical protein